MAKQKWDIDGKGVDPQAGLTYEGPDLPKGSWPAKVKRMTVGKIKTASENQGKPRISILLEVQTSDIPDKAKYHGAPVWDGLNIISSSVGFVNAFLHGLTDGSDAEKRAIESAFWDKDKGPDVKREENKAGETVTHIKRIGKYLVNSPNGELMVQITTKAGADLQKNYRPEVTGYIPSKVSNLKDVDPEDDYEEDGEDDYLDDVEDEVEDDIEDDEDDYEPSGIDEFAKKRKPF